MKNEYHAPEIETAGQANQVVLGVLVVGHDISDEFLQQGGEFQADQR
jgi:hypothetical protein